MQKKKKHLLEVLVSLFPVKKEMSALIVISFFIHSDIKYHGALGTWLLKARSILDICVLSFIGHLTQTVYCS